MNKKHFYILSVILAVIFFHPITSSAQETLFGANGNGSPINPGGIIQISQNNGIGVFIGDPVTPGGLSGIDFNSFGRLFGSTIQGNGSSSTLVEINPNNGSLINTIGGIMDQAGAPLSIGDLAFQPNTDVLFAISSNNASLGGRLYTINTTNGVATFIGQVISRACGLAFAPNGTLYCWEDDLHIVDPSNGNILNTVPTNDDFIDAAAVRSDGTIFGSRCGGCSNPDDIITVDPNTGNTTFIGSTGQGRVSDLAFQPIGPPNSVPTLSQWGLIATAAVLGFIGFVAIRRRKASA